MSIHHLSTKDHLIHDIKAPLQRIKEMGMQSNSPYALKLKQCTQYLENIVESYFGISYKNTDHSIKSIIENKTILFPNIDFTITRKTKIDQITMLNIDSLSLNRIIYNLIQNSYEVLTKLKKNSPNITIKTHNTNKDFYISISDNGCGFPPRILNGLNSSPSHQGRGIGLRAVQSILKESAGEMILSNDRSGAIVTLRIPLIFKNASEVILFDDDKLICKHVENEFKKIDLSIVTNPKRAPKENAIILMDVKLKDECGVNKSKQIKNENHCNVLLFTNYCAKNFNNIDHIDGVIEKGKFSL